MVESVADSLAPIREIEQMRRNLFWLSEAHSHQIRRAFLPAKPSFAWILFADYAQKRGGGGMASNCGQRLAPERDTLAAAKVAAVISERES